MNPPKDTPTLAAEAIMEWVIQDPAVFCGAVSHRQIQSLIKSIIRPFFALSDRGVMERAKRWLDRLTDAISAHEHEDGTYDLKRLAEECCAETSAAIEAALNTTTARAEQ